MNDAPVPDENDRKRKFDEILADVRAQFADLPPNELQALIDEAVSEIRKEMAEERRQLLNSRSSP